MTECLVVCSTRTAVLMRVIREQRTVALIVGLSVYLRQVIAVTITVLVAVVVDDTCHCAVQVR